MQFGTFGLFEARSLLRNTLAQRKRAISQPHLGPHLRPLEPALWLGRVAMVLVTVVALQTDYTQEGGILHSIVGPPAVARQRREPREQRQTFLPTAVSPQKEGVSEVTGAPFSSLLTDVSVVVDFPDEGVWR